MSAKDWNDLHIEQGLDVVRAQIEAAANDPVAQFTQPEIDEVPGDSLPCAPSP